jgi:hypothetical protein
MRSNDASGYSKVLGRPRWPLLESPCWGWLIVGLTVAVFLPAAAHAGCEQVTATLAATVQPQVGPSYVDNGHLVIPITPAMAFRGVATISSHPLPHRHPSPVRPERHGVERPREVCPVPAERAPRRGRVPAPRSVFPIESSCDESTFLFDNIHGKGQDGRTRVLKESDQPT